MTNMSITHESQDHALSTFSSLLTRRLHLATETIEVDEWLQCVYSEAEFEALCKLREHSAASLNTAPFHVANPGFFGLLPRLSDYLEKPLTARPASYLSSGYSSKDQFKVVMLDMDYSGALPLPPNAAYQGDWNERKSGVGRSNLLSLESVNTNSPTYDKVCRVLSEHMKIAVQNKLAFSVFELLVTRATTWPQVAKWAPNILALLNDKGVNGAGRFSAQYSADGTRARNPDGSIVATLAAHLEAAEEVALEARLLPEFVLGPKNDRARKPVVAIGYNTCGRVMDPRLHQTVSNAGLYRSRYGTGIEELPDHRL